LQLTAVCKLDRVGKVQARTRTEDTGAGGNATEVLAGLQVRDKHCFILSVVLYTRIGISIYLRY
jgi:hypothetical protein